MLNSLKVEEFVAILKEFFGNDREKCPDLMRIVNRQHFSRLTSFLTDQRLAKSIVHGGKYNDEKLYGNFPKSTNNNIDILKCPSN